MDEKNAEQPGETQDQVDNSKRNIVAALLGSLGVAALSSCTNQTGEAIVGEPTGKLREAISGNDVGWISSIGLAPDLRLNLRGTAPGIGIFNEVMIAENFYEPAPPNDPDGGGGVFYWSEDTATPDNGGTVIVPFSNAGENLTATQAEQTGCWKRIYSGALNVKWFGAMGDANGGGSGTDDTAAIQRGLDLAATLFNIKTVVLKPGLTYGIAGTLQISSGVTFDGQGAALQRIGSSTTHMIINKHYAQSGSKDTNIAIKHLTLIGTGNTVGLDPQGQGAGIAIAGTLQWYAADVLIEDVTTSNTNGDGIQYRCADRVTLRDVRIGNFGRNGFSPSSGDGGHFENVVVTGSPLSGANPGLDFDVENDASGEMSSTTWINCRGRSISFADKWHTANGGPFAHKTTILGCTFSGGFRPIVVDSDATYTTIADAFVVGEGTTLTTKNGSCVAINNTAGVRIRGVRMHRDSQSTLSTNGIGIGGTVSSLDVEGVAIDTALDNSLLVYGSARLHNARVTNTPMSVVYLSGTNSTFSGSPVGSLTINGSDTSGNTFHVDSPVSWIAETGGGSKTIQSFRYTEPLIAGHKISFSATKPNNADGNDDDICFATGKSEEGTAGSKYVVSHWRKLSGTWYEQRCLTGN